MVEDTELLPRDGHCANTEVARGLRGNLQSAIIASHLYGVTFRPKQKLDTLQAGSLFADHCQSCCVVLLGRFWFQQLILSAKITHPFQGVWAGWCLTSRLSPIVSNLPTPGPSD